MDKALITARKPSGEMVLVTEYSPEALKEFVIQFAEQIERYERKTNLMQVEIDRLKDENGELRKKTEV